MDGSQMSFTRASYRLTAETQKIANERAGAKTFYDAKADKVGWEWIVNQAPSPPIKGQHDTIYVYLLALMPNTDRAGKLSPTAQLTEIMARTRELGTVIVETATGYRSDNRSDRKKMIAFAHESIRLGRRGRLPEGFVKKGRRKKDFSPEALAVAGPIWTNLKIATDDAALAMMPFKMSWKKAVEAFGPSGRPAGRKPKQKRKT